MAVGKNGTDYGYLWWIPGGDFEGVYEASGRGGQGITVWPQKDIVLAFTGRGGYAVSELAPRLAAAIKSDEAIPTNPEACARLNAAVRRATEPPQAQHVPPLPPMAAKVSGKVYQLEKNQLGLQRISLSFNSAADVKFELTRRDQVYEFPVGMDGVARFSETGPTGISVGIVGAWSAPYVFSMQYDEIAGPNHLRIQGVFAENALDVEVELIPLDEGIPSQVVQGRAMTIGQ